MKKRFLYNIRKGFILSICMMLMTGCSNQDKQYSSIFQGKRMTTACNVATVEGCVGAHDYVCANQSDIYLSHKKAIYKYDGMEKLFDVDHLKFMACNEESLFYALSTNGGELWSYNFSEGEKTMLSDAYEIVGMKAYQDDVFVSTTTKEDAKAGESYELRLFHGREPEWNVSEWIMTQEPVADSETFEIYQLMDYKIVVDKTIQADTKQIVLVEAGDAFQYSCYGKQVYGIINNEYFKLTSDITYEYAGKEIELTTITEESDFYAGFSASQVGIVQDKIYILEQYGKGAFGYQENPSISFKDTDALFELTTETGECELVYKCQKGEQLAGFSVEENVVYTLRNDGVYEIDLETMEEDLLLVNEQYLCVVFEYIDDKLLIFQDYYSGDEEIEFLLEVE